MLQSIGDMFAISLFLLGLVTLVVIWCQPVSLAICGLIYFALVLSGHIRP